jgi:mannose-1-phosphate guanylyltransferase/mannose-6-phosphate isomerase
MNIDDQHGRFLSEYVERPWGWYASTFIADGFKTKVFSVNPKQRLSLQSHAHRSEVWTIVSGEGVCYVDGRCCKVKANSLARIPVGAKHRIENTSETENLVIAEVQAGDYLEEDDIVRYEDDYGRQGK